MDNFANVVCLREQQRQRADAGSSPDAKAKQRRVRHFRGLLDRVEACKITEADWLFLKDHSSDIKVSGGFHADIESRLWSRKEDKMKINLEELLTHSRASGNPIVRIDAQHTGTVYASTAKASSANGLEPHIFLAKGAKVMCTWNGWKPARLVNGAVGTVYEIIYEKGQGPPSMPVAILVQFKKGAYNGPSFLKNEGIDGIVKFIPNTERFKDPKTKPLASCSRRQYPLELAYAMTIHKSQGQTLLR